MLLIGLLSLMLGNEVTPPPVTQDTIWGRWEAVDPRGGRVFILSLRKDKSSYLTMVKGFAAPEMLFAKVTNISSKRPGNIEIDAISPAGEKVSTGGYGIAEEESDTTLEGYLLSTPESYRKHDKRRGEFSGSVSLFRNGKIESWSVKWVRHSWVTYFTTACWLAKAASMEAKERTGKEPGAQNRGAQPASTSSVSVVPTVPTDEPPTYGRLQPEAIWGVWEAIDLEHRSLHRLDLRKGKPSYLSTATGPTGDEPGVYTSTKKVTDVVVTKRGKVTIDTVSPKGSETRISGVGVTGRSDPNISIIEADFTSFTDGRHNGSTPLSFVKYGPPGTFLNKLCAITQIAYEKTQEAMWLDDASHKLPPAPSKDSNPQKPK